MADYQSEHTGAQIEEKLGLIAPMAGASSTAPGESGLVPQPQAGDEEKFLAGDGTWKESSAPVIPDATSSKSGLMPSTDKARFDRLFGVNTVTSLTSLPVTKRSITATLAGQTTLSLAADMEVGEELIIRCVPSATFTQPIPNTGKFVSMSGVSLDVTSGVAFEISVWCYATGMYSIAVKEQE